MKKELIKSILEKLAVAIIGGLALICMDWYADFRGIEDKDKQIDYFKDYKLATDSAFKAHKSLFEVSEQKHQLTLSVMKQMIKEDREITLEIIEIAEDSIVTITPFQTDSIRNILYRFHQ